MSTRKGTLRNNKVFWAFLLFAGILLPTFFACKLFSLAIPATNPSQENTAPTLTPEVIPLAEVYLWVVVPDQIATDEQVQLVIFDEVSGLPFNQRQLNTQSLGANTYAVVLHARVGTVVKYRYQRAAEKDIIAEYQHDGTPVYYRMFYVDGPGEIHDTVATWADTPSTANTGRITGTLLASGSDLPIPNVLVGAGGQQAISAADGTFTLDGLPPGQHMLTTNALDGSYLPFKQNALVEAGANTPVEIHIQATRRVPVTLTVSLPPESIPTAPLRLAGDLIQLGNSFNDLGGGISGLVTDMPQLKDIGDNRYQINLSLPVGIVINYKYTLGDGFWNAEFNPDGSLHTRQIFIPPDANSYQVEDRIATWQPGPVNAIWFDVTAPADTPPTDQIYIQFKLIGWMAPVPMWPLGDNRWAFQLLNPPHMPEGLIYRYCHSAVCDGENPDTAEQTTEPRQTITGAPEIVINHDQINAWQNTSPH